MRTIRASEISSFIYCQRAWWYQKQGIASENQAQMAAGTNLHLQHGKSVMAAGILRFLAYGLVLIALGLLAVVVTQALLGAL
jgi:CRISPR/Cas system-associated exonuclease Cas4 (RecB family)